MTSKVFLCCSVLCPELWSWFLHVILWLVFCSGVIIKESWLCYSSWDHEMTGCCNPRTNLFALVYFCVNVLSVDLSVDPTVAAFREVVQLSACDLARCKRIMCDLSWDHPLHLRKLSMVFCLKGVMPCRSFRLLKSIHWSEQFWLTNSKLFSHLLCYLDGLCFFEDHPQIWGYPYSNIYPQEQQWYGHNMITW